MKNNLQSFILGFLIAIGLSLLGVFISRGILNVKALDRTVTVKGLAEVEVPADMAIWPIRFNITDNDLTNLYQSIKSNTDEVIDFLLNNNFDKNEISTNQPAIIDRQAEGYYEANRYKYRYTADVVVTVYSDNVELVLHTMDKLIELGEKGIVIAAQNWDNRTEFLYTGLNDIKPRMIEDATKNGRAVAVKFAKDSDSRLGKIKKAYQGQFSITNRDANTPHIKKVRVVSTLEYYLID